VEGGANTRVGRAVTNLGATSSREKDGSGEEKEMRRLPVHVLNGPVEQGKEILKGEDGKC
jgi:hypothetical protein